MENILKYSVRKAIVPLAGFGTRMYPTIKSIKSEFFPIIDRDGLVKPALLILLEELDNSGIEDICLIIAEKDRIYIDDMLRSDLSDELMDKVSPAMMKYDNKIRRIGKKITFAYQNERLGLGHAVYQGRNFTKGEPVLLVLGDHLFLSNSDKPCARQTIDAFALFDGQITAAISEVALSGVSNLGIVWGQWEDKDETILITAKIYEKPEITYARENLAVKMKRGDKKYFSVFGQYILTQEVFKILERNIREGKTKNGEFDLTSVLDEIRRRKGMLAFVPQGKCFTMENPIAYQETIRNFPKINQNY